MSEYLNNNKLVKLGFSKTGNNNKISNKIRCYSLNGSIGNNVRIDDDVVLKGKIDIKSNVHIARGCTLSGGSKGIHLDDFATLSNFCQLFTKSDEFFLPYLSGGTLCSRFQKKFSKIHEKKILIGKGVIIGSFSLILPGANLKNFSSAGAYSIILKEINSGYFFSNNGKKETLKKRNLKEIQSKYLKIKSALKY